MKEHGILMTPGNTTAIDEGRKGMTRRLTGLAEINKEPDRWTIIGSLSGGSSCETVVFEDDHCERRTVRAPYAVGDRLYIKEPYQITEGDLDTYRVWGKYQRDYKDFSVGLTVDEFTRWFKRKNRFGRTSGMFMYKSLARKWLKVTAVRVERLQDISEDDAIAEGVTLVKHIDEGGHWEFMGFQTDTPLEAFFDGWHSLHGDDKNEWVRVVTFEKIVKE